MIRGARQLLTLRGTTPVRRGPALSELTIIEDGSILIRDRTIIAVGPTRRIENLNESRDALTVPAHGKVVMPGFIDASVSLAMDEAESEPNQRKRKRRTDNQQTDPKLAVLRSCLQHGTALVEVKTRGDLSRPIALATALKEIVQISNNPVDAVPTWQLQMSEAPDEQSLKRFQSTLRHLIRHKLLSFVELHCSSDDHVHVLESMAAAVKNSDVGLKLSWSSNCGKGWAARAAELKALSIAVGADLDQQYVPALAASGSVITLAADNEVLADFLQQWVKTGAAQSQLGRNLIDAGAPVALATGYSPTRPTSVSMQMAIALAVMRLGMTVEEAITAATINAAYAAGYSHVMGSLEVGKQANLLLMNFSDYREIARQFGINHVGMVIRNGNIVYNRTSWKAAAH